MSDVFEAPDPRRAVFVGRRNELARLEGLFESEGVRSVAIVGPPGVGKTALAAEFAESGSGTLGHLLWLDAAAAASLPNESALPASTGLVVVNGYDEAPPEVRGMLAEWVEALLHGGAHVLITSRWAPPTTIVDEVLELRGLSTAEAGELLSSLTEIPEDDLQRAVHALGGTPIALRTFAALLGRTPNRDSVAQILEGLDETDALQSLRWRVRSLGVRSGPTSTPALQARADLARLYADRAQFQEAAIAYEALLSDQLSILGEEHPDVISTMANLAAVHQNLGDFEQALSLYGQALALRSRVLGADHPDTATTLGNLASLHHVVGHHADALALYDGALDAQKRTLGPLHQTTLQTMMNISRLYEETGRREDAAALLASVRADLDRVKGSQGVVSSFAYGEAVRLMETRHRGGLSVSSNMELAWPVYVTMDVSASVEMRIAELNSELHAMVHVLASEPSVGSSVHLSVISFSDSAHVEVPLTRVADVSDLPQLSARGGTSYGPAFSLLREQIKHDVHSLRHRGFVVRRPLIFFISDGEPTDWGWREPLQALMDAYRPNVIAVGYDSAAGSTIAEIGETAAFFLEGPSAPAELIRSLLSSVSASVTNSATSDAGALTIAVPAGAHSLD
jgi:uncharacterized protein YegL/tetratricopeptide (TPR) repeat protein